jgi:uncharacterized UBP type Zn finger protein
LLDVPATLANNTTVNTQVSTIQQSWSLLEYPFDKLNNRIIFYTTMSAPKRVKDLGHVIDGRIRKGWPFQRLRFGGLRQREPDVARSKGLLNPSVLCYRNAVLQCLLHCSEFFLYLGRQDRCATPGDNCVFCALQGLANEYWTNTAAGPRQQALANVNTAMESHQEPDMTYDFLRRAGSDDNDMSASGQQDAHEYLIGLINMLKHINNHRIHGHNIR